MGLRAFIEVEHITTEVCSEAFHSLPNPGPRPRSCRCDQRTGGRGAQGQANDRRALYLAGALLAREASAIESPEFQHLLRTQALASLSTAAFHSIEQL